MEDVVSKYPDMPLLPPPHLLPLKCVCLLLWWKKVFREQPTLSKLAVKAAGLEKLRGSLLVCICVWGGVAARLKP